VADGPDVEGIEKVLITEKPDLVLVYGDTNSTLAGALAASKLHLKLAHVEAGLRSFNRQMPEEINRLVADHLSDLLFCPSQNAVDILTQEGICRGVHLVGDIMADSLALALTQIDSRSEILPRLGIQSSSYLLATIHRAENTDQPDNLKGILNAFKLLQETVVFPVHPRTRKTLEEINYSCAENLKMIDPVGYLDMSIKKNACLILTDSGELKRGLSHPVTLRNEPNVETVQSGWNVAETETSIIEGSLVRIPKIHPSPMVCGEARLFKYIKILESF
jgi:UDP-N-acetylglucosamine 2-epimerase